MRLSGWQRTGLLLACVLAWEAGANVACAQVPLLIPVQASLTDDAGRPVNGELQIAFAIYASEQGGEALYRETRSVKVSGGELGLQLGEVAVIDPELFATHAELYLGVTIEDDDEAEPRLRLGSVPFALSARHAHDATTIDGVGEGELQRRVVGSCASGEVMVAIEVSGSVRCEALPSVQDGVDGAPGRTGPQGEKGERGAPGPAWTFDCEGQAVSAVDAMGRATCTPIAEANVHAGTGLVVGDCGGGSCEIGVAPNALGMGEINLPMSGKQRDPAQLLDGTVLFDDGIPFIPDAAGQCLVIASLEIGTTSPRDPTTGRISLRVGYREDGAVKASGIQAFGTLPTDGKSVASAVQHAVVEVKAGSSYRFGCLISASGEWVNTPFQCQVSRLCQ
jgi:hypothetical protein